MATSTSSTKQRAQGGGRTSNSEPRLQVFKDFAGCNFQESPRDFTLGVDFNQMEQSDLQMNFVVIQNNVAIASNKTMATRNDLEHLFRNPFANDPFTGTSILIKDRLYLATESGNIGIASLVDGPPMKEMKFNGEKQEHHWTSFAYVDDKIIGATKENKLWIGNIGEDTMSPATHVDDPDPIEFDNLSAQGELKIAKSFSEQCPYRVAIAQSYVTDFGPTKVSRELVFYASKPVLEWNSAAYVRITRQIPGPNIVNAIELYYSVDNSSTLLFLDRIDRNEYWEGSLSWQFNWFGYLDTTYSWAVSNLIAPTENYTEGPPASHMICIDSRMYFWGNNEYPYRLYIGGNSGNMFSISPGTGGGFVDIEPGTGQEIRYVDKYKTQSGASIVTMLTDNPNTHLERRYNLVENAVSLSNEQNMKSWQAEHVSGSVGCKSYDGALVCEDGLYSVSRYGLALTTMTMEYNSQIRANYVSDPIKPAFTEVFGTMLSKSCLLNIDGVLYMAFGKNDQELDNMIFCYDIDLKSWWTYTLDTSEPILKMIQVDYDQYREGIGIITAGNVYLMPTTLNDSPEDKLKHNFLIETGELSAQKPEQGWIHLSQLEFCFDYFVGDCTIEVVGIDQFGRSIKTVKTISHDTTQYDLCEYMRIDLKLQSYKIVMAGTANFRLTHFMAKEYVMSAKVGLVWGFDDRQSYRKVGDIHPMFKNYNDIRLAIVP